jgi:hypothetical protein
VRKPWPSGECTASPSTPRSLCHLTLDEKRCLFGLPHPPHLRTGTGSVQGTTSSWSGAPHAGPVRHPATSLLPHRLRWSETQLPREWRNGRRAGLRIRCPKGRGSSTLPSRTTSDLRIFSSSLYRQSARETFLLTLAHENFVSSSPGTRPGPRLVGRPPMASLPDPTRCGCLDRRNRRGKPEGPWLQPDPPGGPWQVPQCGIARCAGAVHRQRPPEQ